eukprot:TRINITY_DN46_c0_g1_i2.p1 TRINITY_DN46_c0_g1~~TRINITY_DN46_c0_g1_i2.p1  ORF type:complete len:109 (-),score=16.72 TRINITY_DN46_c0_g1_i2:133-432(-)
MGGSGKYAYPKYVWSPTGGWWNTAPKNWLRNTYFALFGIFVTASTLFYISASNERRSIPLRPIPSQSWAKHTLDDDPDYFEKRELYHQNKKSFLSRVLP